MAHILFITMKDIRQTLRDKMTFLFLLAMPIAFSILFGVAFGGLFRSSTDQRPVIGLVDHDKSPFSQGMKALLEQQSGFRVEQMEGDLIDLDKLVIDQEVAAVIIIPNGYGESLQSGNLPKPQLILDPVSGVSAQNAVYNATWRASSAAAAARIAAGEQPERFIRAYESAYTAWLNPPARMRVISADAEAGSTAVDNGSQAGVLPVSHTAPAMMIQFALAGLLTAAQVLVQERKTRCMQRLLTTRVHRHEILIGHFLAIFTMIFVQFVLLIGFGQLLLGVDYLRLPLATLAMMVSTAIFVAALGLLIGALARTDEQAVIFAMAPMFIFSALGGAWLPLEATGEAFRSIGQVTPVALALEGFKTIIASSMGLNAVLVPAVALLGYAVVFAGLAVWKFKFE